MRFRILKNFNILGWQMALGKRKSQEKIIIGAMNIKGILVIIRNRGFDASVSKLDLRVIFDSC